MRGRAIIAPFSCLGPVWAYCWVVLVTLNSSKGEDMQAQMTLRDYAAVCGRIARMTGQRHFCWLALRAAFGQYADAWFDAYEYGVVGGAV